MGKLDYDFWNGLEFDLKVGQQISWAAEGQKRGLSLIQSALCWASIYSTKIVQYVGDNGVIAPGAAAKSWIPRWEIIKYFKAVDHLISTIAKTFTKV